MDGVDLRSVPPPALRIFRRRVGIIFQDRKLLPGRTVAEHVAFPLEIAGASDETIAKRVPEVLSRLHLNSRASAFPSELSMGQQTLLAIGRAIAHQPLILIADDPVRDLDAAEAAEVLALLHDMQAKGTTVIVASRDAALATQLNARSLTLDHGALTTDSINRGREAVETIRAAKRDTIEKTTEKVKVRATKEDHALHRKVKVTAIHSD
jgi:cell division transport system ATP-binding protein